MCPSAADCGVATKNIFCREMNSPRRSSSSGNILSVKCSQFGPIAEALSFMLACLCKSQETVCSDAFQEIATWIIDPPTGYL
jgi:hypothetical protein